jgi:hypothetical protein
MLFNAVRFLHTLAVLALLLGCLTVPPVVGERATQQHTPNLAGAARLTSDQAIAVAVNDLSATADGYRLHHPQHVATFTPDGLQFTPRGGGPAWAWHLTAVRAGDVPLVGVTVGAVRPTSEQPGTVTYQRGGLVEQYLARRASLEQQFVFPRPLSLDGADLVIAGAVRCAGTFEAAENGWQWTTPEGAIHLGDVRAYDASGRDLPATMRVTATGTCIVVDGAALAAAAYPVTVDPEIGANDFRLSDMGGDVLFDASLPAVAYNSHDNEYLVVWCGDDDTGGLVDGESEIFGQRVDAATGAEIGADLRLSDMGPDGSSAYVAFTPAVAYNSANNEYLVVWYGDDDTAPLVDNETEIFGQRVNAATGAEIGTNDFRLSDMGPDGNTGYSVYRPAVAYNSTDNEYLVVWRGDDNAGGLVDNEFEVFGQRVNAATGAEIGTDFRLSDMGPDGNANYDAYGPAVAYNSTNNQYLVVWDGDDNTGGLVDEEYEVFGQRVDAASGAEIGADFRLSDMGPDGNANYDADRPAVAYNSTNNQYLVVWEGDDDTAPLVNGEQEVFGQRVNGATGAEIGGDFRLSDMGPDGDVGYVGAGPAVAYNSTDNQYLVVWAGDDNTFPLVNDEFEVFGQRVEAATGAEIGDDFRLSDMGPNGNVNYGAGGPAVAYNRTNNEYLVVWQGDDNTPPLVDGEHEIFGQRVDGATGAEIGADLRLTDVGPDGNASYDAFSPAVTYNSVNNEYMVVWYGDDDTAPLVDGEYEIFGQRVNGATGAEIGANDFRLSDMGPDGDTSYVARYPAVACNSTNNEYLVVWRSDDNTPPLVKGEFEIFGQRFAPGYRLYLPLVVRAH